MTNKLRTIHQAATETGLSPDTLRYYERIGLITNVRRAANGHRRYTDADMIWIGFLKQLRATGMPIQQMRQFADLRRGGAATLPERVTMLQAHRAELERQVDTIQAFMVVIDAKIDRHLHTLSTPLEEDTHDRQ